MLGGRTVEMSRFSNTRKFSAKTHAVWRVPCSGSVAQKGDVDGFGAKLRAKFRPSRDTALGGQGLEVPRFSGTRKFSAKTHAVLRVPCSVP